MRDGENNFDLLGARKTFDKYEPGQSVVDLSVSDAEANQEPTEEEAAEEKVSTAKDPTISSPQEPQEDPRGSFSGE